MTRPVPSLEEIRSAGLASDATATGLIRVLQALIGDLNQGRSLRALASYSDDFLRRRGTLAADEIEALRRAGPPRPPAEQERLVGLRDARLLADGRASATVITARPNEPEQRCIVIFAPHGGRWRIDADLG